MMIYHRLLFLSFRVNKVYTLCLKKRHLFKFPALCFCQELAKLDDKYKKGDVFFWDTVYITKYSHIVMYLRLVAQIYVAFSHVYFRCQKFSFQKSRRRRNPAPENGVDLYGAGFWSRVCHGCKRGRLTTLARHAGIFIFRRRADTAPLQTENTIDKLYDQWRCDGELSYRVARLIVRDAADRSNRIRTTRRTRYVRS